MLNSNKDQELKLLLMRVYPLNVNLKWPMCCKCQKYAEVLEYKRSFWSTGKRLLAALQLSWWRRPETQRQLLSVIHNSPSSTPWTKSVLQSSTGRVLFAGVPPPPPDLCVCVWGGYSSYWKFIGCYGLFPLLFQLLLINLICFPLF